jgi:hypothetical protein
VIVFDMVSWEVFFRKHLVESALRISSRRKATGL